MYQTPPDVDKWLFLLNKPLIHWNGSRKTGLKKQVNGPKFLVYKWPAKSRDFKD